MAQTGKESFLYWAGHDAHENNISCLLNLCMYRAKEEEAQGNIIEPFSVELYRLLGLTDETAQAIATAANGLSPLWRGRTDSIEFATNYLCALPQMCTHHSPLPGGLENVAPTAIGTQNVSVKGTPRPLRVYKYSRDAWRLVGDRAPVPPGLVNDDEHLKLYHGTTVDNVVRILRQGIRAQNNTRDNDFSCSDRPGYYTTTDYAQAANRAFIKSGRNYHVTGDKRPAIVVHSFDVTALDDALVSGDQGHDEFVGASEGRFCTIILLKYVCMCVCVCVCL